MEEEEHRQREERKILQTKEIAEEAQDHEILIEANGEAAIQHSQWKWTESHFSRKGQTHKAFLLSVN